MWEGEALVLELYVAGWSRDSRTARAYRCPLGSIIIVAVDALDVQLAIQLAHGFIPQIVKHMRRHVLSVRMALLPKRAQGEENIASRMVAGRREPRCCAVCLLCALAVGQVMGGRKMSDTPVALRRARSGLSAGNLKSSCTLFEHYH